MSDETPMDIDYVANLARIELSDEEKSTYQKQLGDVLKYFDKLQELDVENVEPTAHAFPVTMYGIRMRHGRTARCRGFKECSPVEAGSGGGAQSD